MEPIDWGEAIHVYSDEQAVDDGFLVPLHATDGSETPHRVTRAAFEWLRGNLPNGPPPFGWAVSLLKWIDANGIDRPDEARNLRALSACEGLVSQHASRAHKAWADNSLLALVVETYRTGMIRKLHRPTTNGETPRTNEGEPLPHRLLWILPNELGGVTIMFPEDR